MICSGWVDLQGVTHKCGTVIRRNYATENGKDSHGLCGRCRKKYYQVIAKMGKPAQNEEFATNV